VSELGLHPHQVAPAQRRSDQPAGQGSDFGFKIENLTVDYAPAQKRSRQVSDRLVKGVGFLFRKNNITHVVGAGELVGPKQVKVTPAGQVLEAKDIIVATGARARSLRGWSLTGRGSLRRARRSS